MRLISALPALDHSLARVFPHLPEHLVGLDRTSGSSDRVVAASYPSATETMREKIPWARGRIALG